ncbi:PREDICTED: uncharacterized protein LOC109209705 [Nicotiana attenuata]|uniref:uncharacterized protein LOC109209705 n=1 Tax=Nicotiana attenuata TaxID=49451 RepID=UPI0009057B6A|nr:PREDICTED: uncharacterized protein LOC109209705 [Nicotiana attenuata]
MSTTISTIASSTFTIPQLPTPFTNPSSSHQKATASPSPNNQLPPSSPLLTTKSSATLLSNPHRRTLLLHPTHLQPSHFSRSSPLLIKTEMSPSSSFQQNTINGGLIKLEGRQNNMEVKPAVAVRAILVGGIAAFAKIGGAVKVAGGIKVGAAAAAMTAAATAAISGSKQEAKTASQHSSK